MTKNGQKTAIYLLGGQLLLDDDHLVSSLDTLWLKHNFMHIKVKINSYIKRHQSRKT